MLLNNQEITEEIKDFKSRLMFDSAIGDGKLIIQDVPEEFEKKVNFDSVRRGKIPRTRETGVNKTF